VVVEATTMPAEPMIETASALMRCERDMDSCLSRTRTTARADLPVLAKCTELLSFLKIGKIR
jgi:hypothetical protein